MHTNNAILRRPRVTPAPAMEPASPIPPWIEKPEECRWFYGDERPVSAIPETRYPDGRSVVVFVEGNLAPASLLADRPLLLSQLPAKLWSLQNMWYEGEIGPDTLVWTEGMGRRTRVRDMPTLLGILRGDEDEPAGLDQLLADAADADHERVADGATTSFGDEALLDAELGSGSSSWELNGGRQRAAAAAAAAEEVPRRWC